MNTNFFVSECIKMKRSGFYSIVLGTPVITGLCYIFYCFCSKDFATDAFYYYILTLSIISPCILSFGLYIPFNIERKCCNGKELFSNQYGLKKAITEKICFIFISYLSSLIISIFIFCTCWTIISNLTIPVHYFYVIPIMLLGQLSMFLALTLGILLLNKSIILIGIGCTLLNGILMTKIGNGIWYYFPNAWSTLLSHFYLKYSGTETREFQMYILLITFCLCTFAFYLFIRFWLLNKIYFLIEHNYNKY